MRKVLPYLKREYFENDKNNLFIFNTIVDYVGKYNRLPTKEVLKLRLEKDCNISDEQAKEIYNIISELKPDNNDINFLVDSTEKFCQETALYNALMTSIKIVDEKKQSVLSKGIIPDLLTKALSVTFDNRIGHDFTNDADIEERYDFYHKLEEKIPFDIEIFNKITKGGVSKKALIIAMGSTGVGKTLFMCHFAAANMMLGKNVLYITLEMAEERIAQRIDANLLDITVDELQKLSKEEYKEKLNRIKSRTTGKLVIKEYYTTMSPHVGHFRHLLNELKTKKNFIPDIIYIDYLNLCSSFKYNNSSNINSYSTVKSVAEEIRGLAMEKNICIFSATQTNRGGFSNTELELTDMSESIGVSYTADMVFGISTSDELEKSHKILIKQLKNRWGDLSYYGKFVVGIDRSHMKLFDSKQDDIVVPENQQSDNILNSGFKVNTKSVKPKISGFN